MGDTLHGKGVITMAEGVKTMEVGDELGSRGFITMARG